MIHFSHKRSAFAFRAPKAPRRRRHGQVLFGVLGVGFYRHRGYSAAGRRKVLAHGGGKGEEEQKSQNGFTLVETLIAISVLLVALGGPMTIAQRGLSAAFVSRDQVTASFLAQEAIEYVRKVRDGNGIAGSGTSWLSGLDPACVTSACRVDALANTVAACPAGGCPALRYNTTNHTYNYSSVGPNNVLSPFIRSVRITRVPNADCPSPALACEVTVTVTVSWQTRMNARTTTVVDYLLDWQK